MKKFRRSLLALLSLACVGTAAVGFAGCSVKNAFYSSSQNSSSIDTSCVHEWESVTTKEATCTEKGLVTDVCLLCGEDYSMILPALDHDYVDHAAQEHTCTEIGWKAYQTCTRCTYTSYTEIPAEHDYVARVCTRCSQKQPSKALNYTLNEAGTSYLVTGIGMCTDKDIVISATYNDLPVTTIGEKAFYNCKNLTSVVIPDSVTTIGGYAFDGCDNLTSVVIPDSVTSIGSSAFCGCESLTSVVIPDSVTEIGGSAFRNCTSLTSVVIGDSVTSIGWDAFYNTGYYNDESNWENGVLYIAKHLIKAKDTMEGAYTIKDGTLCIAGGAFYNCKNLTSVVIPDSVTSIGWDAFRDSTSLTSVVIPDSVTSIGNGAFLGCSSLTSIEIPDSVTTIGDYAFYNCKNLTSIDIPDSVTTIGEYAFRYCSSLTSVVIPDSVTTIGSSAFEGCSSLTSIEIPDSVTSIGRSAFEYCYNLTSITFEGTVAEWNAISKGYWNDDVPATEVVCSDGTVTLW